MMSANTGHAKAFELFGVSRYLVIPRFAVLI